MCACMCPKAVFDISPTNGRLKLTEVWMVMKRPILFSSRFVLVLRRNRWNLLYCFPLLASRADATVSSPERFRAHTHRERKNRQGIDRKARLSRHQIKILFSALGILPPERQHSWTMQMQFAHSTHTQDPGRRCQAARGPFLFADITHTHTHAHTHTHTHTHCGDFINVFIPSQHLQRACLFVALSSYGKTQQQLLFSINTDESKELEQIPAYKNLLKFFTTKEIIQWPLQVGPNGDEALKTQSIFKTEPKWELRLKRRVTEHVSASCFWNDETMFSWIRLLQCITQNVRVIAHWYTRIRLDRFAELLDVERQELENIVSRMVCIREDDAGRYNIMRVDDTRYSIFSIDFLCRVAFNC